MKILFVGILNVFWSDHIPIVKVLKSFGNNVSIFNCRTIAVEKMLIKNSSMIAKTLRKLRNQLIESEIHSTKSDERMTIYKGYEQKNTNFINWLFNPLIKFNVWYGRRIMNKILLNKVKNNNYALVFFANSKIISYRTILKINQYSKTWYYFVDPISIAIALKAERFAKSCFWSSASFSDVNNFFNKNGANSILLQIGADTKIYFPKKQEKNIDVFFLGAKDKKREFFINFLLKNNIHVQCYGYGWKNGPLFTNNIAEKYRNSKIILNFVRKGSGFSIRVFQAMATGSFLLSECCPDLKRFFQLKEHLDCFKNRDQLLEKVLYFLKNSEEREKIAENGCKFVHKNYSMEAIMKKILNIIKE